MKNIYKNIYPNVKSDYWYECPQCCEPVPLKLDSNHRTLKGYCQNCHLDIDILEEDFWEWKKIWKRGINYEFKTHSKI